MTEVSAAPCIRPALVDHLKGALRVADTLPEMIAVL